MVHLLQIVAQGIELGGVAKQGQIALGWLILIIGVLFLVDLFVPFYLYADATKRRQNGMPWAVGAFFGMAVPYVLAGVFAVNFNLAAFVIFATTGFLVPFVLLFVYLIRRTPVMQRACPECGAALQSSWRNCPYCEQARMGSPAPAMAGGAPMYVPPPVPAQASGTALGARGDKSTMVRPREEKRTIRRKDKEAGPTLGWLVVKGGRGSGKEYKISKEITNIGRDTSNEIVVSDDETSRQHSRLRFEDGKFVLYDLGSANGTHLNGEEIQKAVLEDGDIVRIGSTEMTFKTV